MKKVEELRRHMEETSTDALIQIWRENDRTQYVDEAFEAIRQLLTERGETIPPQLPVNEGFNVDAWLEAGSPWDYEWAAIDGVLKLSKIEYHLKRGEIGKALDESNFLSQIEQMAVQRLISDTARESHWIPKEKRSEGEQG